MKDKEILEGNTLIAEFMNLVIKDTIAYISDKPCAPNEKYLAGYKITHAKYDTSWDWLMPVLKECRKVSPLGYSGSDIQMRLNQLEIREVWLAVVEFIKWHNHNERRRNLRRK